MKNNQASFKSKIMLLIERLFLECTNYIQWIPHFTSFLIFSALDNFYMCNILPWLIIIH